MSTAPSLHCVRETAAAWTFLSCEKDLAARGEEVTTKVYHIT